MSTREQTFGAAPEAAATRRLVLGTLLFLLLFAVGLYIVKWSPYWHKTHVAAVTHSIGSSIVSGKSTQAPPVGIAAAWSYALAYYKAIWQAFVLALVLGASVAVFVPRRWLHNLMGDNSFRATAVAGGLSLAGMMCTCCAGPLAVGLRRQNVGIGGALAFFLGNPVLNPATLLFIGFVLGWPFAGLRIVFGAILVFFVSYFATRFADRQPAYQTPPIEPALAPIEDPNRTAGSICVAWLRELWTEIATIVPGYIVIVLLLGAARAWLFPPQLTIHASGFGAIVALSAIGTAFVIPTAGEVPIVQTLMHAGMGVGPAAALLLTLPAISIPSLFIVRGAFPKRVLAFVTACVFALGIVGGIFAMLFMRA